jgi:hypothetical protein
MSSLLVNILNRLSCFKQNITTDFTKKLHYFTLYFSGKAGKTVAYCSLPLGHLFIPYEDGSFYCIKEIFIDGIYDKL